MDSVTSLYNHVEEQAHALVQRSNMSMEYLEYLLQLREIEGHLMQVHCNISPSDLFRPEACFYNILGLVIMAITLPKFSQGSAI